MREHSNISKPVIDKRTEKITKQYQRDYLYMRMARTWAENCYCVRRKVGALLVKCVRALTSARGDRIDNTDMQFFLLGQLFDGTNGDIIIAFKQWEEPCVTHDVSHDIRVHNPDEHLT